MYLINGFFFNICRISFYMTYYQFVIWLKMCEINKNKSHDLPLVIVDFVFMFFFHFSLNHPAINHDEWLKMGGEQCRRFVNIIVLCNHQSKGTWLLKNPFSHFIYIFHMKIWVHHLLHIIYDDCCDFIRTLNPYVSFLIFSIRLHTK